MEAATFDHLGTYGVEHNFLQQKELMIGSKSDASVVASLLVNSSTNLTGAIFPDVQFTCPKSGAPVRNSSECKTLPIGCADGRM